MKKASLYIFFLLGFGVLSAQITGTIRESVTDADSRSSLPGATVTIEQNAQIINGAYSDEKGNYRIEGVPVGRYTVRVRYIGYEELQLPNIQINSGKEVVMNLQMQESFVSGDTVEIVASRRTETRNEMATVSARPFTIDESMRYAGSRNDPARMAQNFAGVTGSNDQRNDIIIRGNSPTGVLWRLEGVDIANPNHFSTFGTTGGPVSALNANLLANSDFLTSAFPAGYGNATAGVFDLRMRNGNNERHEFIGQLGINGIEAIAEGPFSKKKPYSFLVGYRYNNLRLFQDLGISFGSTSVPVFQDLSFKLNFPTEKAGTFSFFGIGALSNVEVLDSKRDTSDFFGPSGTDIRFNSRIANSGLSHLFLIDANTWIKSTLSWSFNSMDSRVDSVRKATGETNKFYSNISSQHKAGFNTVFNRKFNSRNTLKAGFFADMIFYDLRDTVFLTFPIDTFFSPTNFTERTFLLQPYAAWKYRITEDLTLNSGVHATWLQVNNTWAVEPRIGLKWQFLPRHSLAAGYGLHSQMQPIFVYFAQRENAAGELYKPNVDLPLQRSQHFVLSYDYFIGKDFKLKAEAYYQSIWNAGVRKAEVNSYSLMNQGADFWTVVPDSLSPDGKGRNYGMEITLEKFLSKNYYFLVTASVYDSKYTGSDGVWRNTAFNGRYAVNTLGGADIVMGKKKNLILSLNLKNTVAGGQRYTPIDTAASALLNREVRIDSMAFTEQQRLYWRTDFRIGFRINSKRVSQEIAFDFANILNRKNVLFQVYDAELNAIREVYQLGFFPIFQYRIEF